MGKGRIGTSMVSKRITKKMRNEAKDNYGLSEEEVEAIRKRNLANSKLSEKTLEKLRRKYEFEK